MEQQQQGQQQPQQGPGGQQGMWPSQSQQQQQPQAQMPMGQGGFVPLAQQQPQMMMQPGLPQQQMMQQPQQQQQMDQMGQMGSMPMMPMQFGSMQMPPMTPMQMQMMMMQMFSMMPQNFGSFYPPGQMPMNPAQSFPGQPFPDQFQQQQQQFRQPDPYQQDPNLFPPPLGPSQIIPARPEMIRLAHGPGSARQWIDSCYGRMDSNLDFVLKEWFQSVDQDRSGHIDKEELKMALNAAGETFSPSTIRMMIDMFDTDKNGTIDFDEFRHLFKYIQVLREAFEAQDRDRDNRLNLGEVRQALAQAQYDFKDPKTTVKLLQRFDPKERNALVFENFVELAIQLGQTRTLFTKLDTDKDKIIKLNLDEVVSLTLDYS